MEKSKQSDSYIPYTKSLITSIFFRSTDLLKVLESFKDY